MKSSITTSIILTSLSEALKKLKDLYDLHSKLKFIQLQLKLFNPKLKDNDPMSLASKVKATIYDINVSSGKVDLSLKDYIKALPPTIHTILSRSEQVANSSR